MELPDDLKAIINTAAKASNTLILSAFDAKNTEYYYKLKDEDNVDFREYPAEVINRLNKLTKDVIDEIVSKDPMSKKAFESYTKFRKKIIGWFEISERNYV